MGTTYFDHIGIIPPWGLPFVPGPLMTKCTLKIFLMNFNFEARSLSLCLPVGRIFGQFQIRLSGG
jgi:hypothetical protein